MGVLTKHPIVLFCNLHRVVNFVIFCCEIHRSGYDINASALASSTRQHHFLVISFALAAIRGNSHETALTLDVQKTQKRNRIKAVFSMCKVKHLHMA